MNAETLARATIDHLGEWACALTVDMKPEGVEITGWNKGLQAFREVARDIAPGPIDTRIVLCGLTCDDPSILRLSIAEDAA